MCVVGPAHVGVLVDGCPHHWVVVCGWQIGPAARPKGGFHHALAGHGKLAGLWLRPNIVRLRSIALET